MRHISFCVDLLLRIKPTRVLDVGIGLGRWPMILREFWARTGMGGAESRITGLAFDPEKLCHWHYDLYDEIRVAETDLAFPGDGAGYELVLIEDHLEQLDREQGALLLERALENADYVLVCVRLGCADPKKKIAGKSWHSSDFFDMQPRVSRFFLDERMLPLGVFLLSASDPAGLEEDETIGDNDRSAAIRHLEDLDCLDKDLPLAPGPFSWRREGGGDE